MRAVRRAQSDSAWMNVVVVMIALFKCLHRRRVGVGTRAATCTLLLFFKFGRGHMSN